MRIHNKLKRIQTADWRKI